MDKEEQPGGDLSISDSEESTRRTDDGSDITSGKDANNGDFSRNSSTQERLLRRTRCVVLTILILGAGVVGYVSHRLSSQQEQNEFAQDFESVSEEILEESEIRARNVFGTIQTMATVTTTLSLTMNTSWPFVTLPKFEAWAGGLSLALTGAESLSFGVFVSEQERGLWANYSETHASLWIQESVKYHEDVVIAPSSSADAEEESEESSEDEEASDSEEATSYSIEDALETPVIHNVWKHLPDGSIVPDVYDRAAVNWQMTPVRPADINHNDLELDSLRQAFANMEADNQMILSPMIGEEHASFLLQPVFRQVDDSDDEASEIVGYFKAKLPWNTYFQSLLPSGKNGVHVVVENTCGQTVTYQLDGPQAFYVGDGDLHDTAFDDIGEEEEFDPLEIFKGKTSGCEYEIHIYPTEIYRANFQSTKPALYSAVSVLVLVFATVIFLWYDWSVRQRQEQLVTAATRSNAIVNSLFPANVRARLLESENTSKNKNGKESGYAGKFRNPFAAASPQTSLQATAAKALELVPTRDSKPIADLFPAATVLFADISGFTAWSSVREPSQVFTLLESVYDSFDQIAKKRGVFKVETIGDCYVAVAGLPTPRPDHALVMANFARKCMDKMHSVVTSLEVMLGPGTADLAMRFGLHSGPVMAGVLRGEKSRFQLFGDTVNTCSRIEQTGAKNRIHLSKATADLLIDAGKETWVKPRSSLVSAKGKGSLQTYWLNNIHSSLDELKESRLTDLSESSSDIGNSSVNGLGLSSSVREASGKFTRLVDFNTKVLARFLKLIVAMRDGDKPLVKTSSSSELRIIMTDRRRAHQPLVIDEVQEILELPSEPTKYRVDPDSVQLPDVVLAELRDYVNTISSLYHSNPFHSFDHACHVTMSITKLLSRVVTPDKIDYNDMCYKTKGESMHEFTYGITSDPLTQFAVAFSALIHDVDHQGVPNAQLVAEKAAVAKTYQNQSVAEQNSVNLAWSLLQEPCYGNLRACIYKTQDEHDRFRQLVINAVMATDIMDKDLGALRRRRWEKAFHPPSGDDDDSSASSEKENSNRKATIVIEHLIQASDVAHTMQHWHVYVKWNKRLFFEMYRAYLNGRGATDPSVGWYQGEIGFLDHYVIPLAKKLKECGVFGVSSDEYLDYAEANRIEWEDKGKELVEEYVREFHEAQRRSSNGSSADSPKSEQYA